mmetsp:Transcript_12532/g.21106  ORF Transcript_12532/g.21106 Transcript_12532/m.21106 type:complete len:135 (+) Transcript_12532:68-472(+)
MESSLQPEIAKGGLSIETLNYPWLWNSAEDPDSNTKWEAYDDLTCIMIEQAFQNFQTSEGLEKDGQLNITGGYSVDFKNMVQFMTNDHSKKRKIKRAEPGSRRQRPSNSSRFNSVLDMKRYNNSLEFSGWFAES